MNYINTNIFISLFLGILFCFAGRYIRIQNHSNELIWSILCGMAALPALLFALYYLHLVEPPITLLGKEGDNYIIGEPLKGPLTLSEAEFKKNYKLHPIAFQFIKK